jgi:hypothetical protein
LIIDTSFSTQVSITEHLQEPKTAGAAFATRPGLAFGQVFHGFPQRNWGKNYGNFRNTTVNFYETW